MRASIEYILIIITITSINSQEFHKLNYYNNDTLSENDSCKMANGVYGTCQKLTNCRVEYESYQRNGTVLNVCQYRRAKNDLVCCPHVKEFPDDYFGIEKCRDRHLILRTTKKSAKDIINRTAFGNDTEDIDDFYHILREARTEIILWQFVATIGYTQDNRYIKYQCSGSIISDQFIITAAKCEKIHGKLADVVRVGDRFLEADKDDEHAQELKIKSFTCHPKYQSQQAYDDIALVKTVGKIKFNNFVAPACIGNVDNNPQLLKIDSYGQIEFMETQSSHVHHEILVHTFPSDICNEFLRGQPIASNGVLSSQICTMNQAGNYTQSCRGDFGSSLKYKYNYEMKDADYDRTKLKTIYEIPVVVGVVSYGFQCGLSIPTISTKISHYYPWILSIMNEL